MIIQEPSKLDLQKMLTIVIKKLNICFGNCSFDLLAQNILKKCYELLNVMNKGKRADLKIP